MMQDVVIHGAPAARSRPKQEVSLQEERATRWIMNSVSQAGSRFEPGYPDVVLANGPDVLAELKAQIEQLKARLSALEAEVEKNKPSVEDSGVVVLRTISRKQAKEEIRELFATGETLYISEVADHLNLPDQLVVEICWELQREGELMINDDILRAQ